MKAGTGLARQTRRQNIGLHYDQEFEMHHAGGWFAPKLDLRDQGWRTEPYGTDNNSKGRQLGTGLVAKGAGGAPFYANV